MNRWLVTSSSNRMVQVLGQRLDRAAADGGQELLELGHAVVEPLDHGIDLGAQAGGQDDGLGQVGLVPQPAEGLGQGALGHRHPLEQVERGLALLEADDDHRHAVTTSSLTWFASCFTWSSASVGVGPADSGPPVQRRRDHADSHGA